MSENTKANQPDAATTREAARQMYETTPATLVEVAAEFCVAYRTIARWSAADGGGSKLNGPEITDRAQAVADKIQTAVTDIGQQAGEDERQAVVARLREDAAVDQRAAVLARHRSEWNVVRGLVAEAVKGRDQAKAKLALDVGRALDLAQRGECRAWGIDPGDVQGGVTVIIERA